MRAAGRKPPVGEIDYEKLAQQLAPRVAALVLARLATGLGAIEAPYSTRRGHEPPEFIGRLKLWRSTAPTIPGARRLGRWVIVSRSAYAAWLAAQPSAQAPRPAQSPANDSGWSHERMAEAMGLRGSRS
jgi:hypothetical protein